MQVESTRDSFIQLELAGNLKKFCSLFINMAFFTNVREFQAALNACLTVRDSETLASANF